MFNSLNSHVRTYLDAQFGGGVQKSPNFAQKKDLNSQLSAQSSYLDVRPHHSLSTPFWYIFVCVCIYLYVYVYLYVYKCILRIFACNLFVGYMQFVHRLYFW